MQTTDVGLLIVRLVVGLIFAAHGAQKAFGWWAGPGWTGWVGVMERLRFRPTRVFAGVSMATELGGGLLLAAGFLTPVATMLIIGQSVVIIFKAHWPRGFWNRDNGFEFPLALAGGALGVALTGPGAISLDAVAGLLPPDGVRLVLVALGLIGGVATLAVPQLNRLAPGEDPPPS
jgi:putative oxidoreductase